MSVSRKENGSLVKKAGRALVDLALNRNSNKSIANSAVSDCLLDGIGNTNEKFRFGTDGQGNYGYIKKVGGADTFFPFKASLEYVTLSKTNAINSSSYIYTDSIDTNSDSTKFVKVDGYADVYSHSAGTSCTIVAQGSNDNTTWSNIKSTSFVRNRQSSASGSTGWIPTTYRYLRAGGNGGSDGNVNSTLTIESYF